MGVFGMKPVRKYLAKQLEARNKRAAVAAGAPTPTRAHARAERRGREKAEKEEWDMAGLALGLPDDLAGDIDAARREIQHEIELRRRRGSTATMPSGQELKAAIEDKIGREL